MKWRCPECSRVFEDIGEPLLCPECLEAAKPEPEPEPEVIKPEPEPEIETLISLMKKAENFLPQLLFVGLAATILFICSGTWDSSEPDYTPEPISPYGGLPEDVREVMDAFKKQDRHAIERGEMLPSEFRKRYYEDP